VAGEGSVSSSFKAGVVMLENVKRESFRLSWTKGESGKQRLRSLPAGEYRLRTFRIEELLDGQLWHISASAPNIQRVLVREGEHLTLELESNIKMKSKLKGKAVMMGISSSNGAGLSIYRDGVRIPISYKVLDAHGKPEAKGSMNYG
jgi:hypothetical protein